MADQGRSSYNLVIHAMERQHIEAYLQFQELLLRSFPHAQYHIAALRKLLRHDHPAQVFLSMRGISVYSGEEMVGNIVVSTDSRLPRIGIFGFYACIDDDDVATLLITNAERLLQEGGCTQIRGPIELTIWHSYRFVLHQESSFFLEPLNPAYYVRHFERNGYARSDRQVSAMRDDFETLLLPTGKSLAALHERGIEIRLGGVEDLHALHALSLRTFLQSWSFVPLSSAEFIDLYASPRGKPFVHVAYDGDAPVGFCFGVIDPLDASTFILKTIAVLPSHQQHGIGAALLHMQHEAAARHGCTKAIYALIRVGNTVTKLPYPGARVIREYVAFEKSLH